YGPEKKPWFDKMANFFESQQFSRNITKVLNLLIVSFIILWYDIIWWTALGIVSIRYHTFGLIMMMFLTVVPICLLSYFAVVDEINNRLSQILSLLSFAFLLIFQSLWFSICFPISSYITKSIIGLTLLSVGRIIYYMTYKDSGDHGFFNGFKKGISKRGENHETNLKVEDQNVQNAHGRGRFDGFKKRITKKFEKNHDENVENVDDIEDGQSVPDGRNVQNDRNVHGFFNGVKKGISKKFEKKKRETIDNVDVEVVQDDQNVQNQNQHVHVQGPQNVQQYGQFGQNQYVHVQEPQNIPYGQNVQNQDVNVQGPQNVQQYGQYSQNQYVHVQDPRNIPYVRDDYETIKILSFNNEMG
ncbi:1555_t:CDS:2, partial [Diversispora eburnea]